MKKRPEHRPDSDEWAGFPTAPMDQMTDNPSTAWKAFATALVYVAGLVGMALTAGWIVDSLTK